MATLSEAVKTFIVTNLACWDTPTEVVEAVKDAFGVECSRQQVQYYDPTRVGGGKPAKKWCALFESTRERFLDEVSEIPIANQAYRLRQLQRSYQAAMSMGRTGNLGLARDILKQAAEEVGGKFTNHHVLEADVKGEVQHSGVMVVGEMDPREWAGLAREQQAHLEDAARRATEEVLPNLEQGNDGPPRSGG